MPCPPPGGSSQPKEDFLHLLELAGGVFTTEPLGKPTETPKQRPSWEGPGVGKGELCSLLQGSRENRGGLGASPWGGTRRQHQGPARVCCLLGSRAGEAHVSEHLVYPLETTGQAECSVHPKRPPGRQSAPSHPRGHRAGVSLVLRTSRTLSVQRNTCGNISRWVFLFRESCCLESFHSLSQGRGGYHLGQRGCCFALGLNTGFCFGFLPRQ